MCFRPATAAVDVKCPGCGETISPLGGLYPPNCPYCNADLSEVTANGGSGETPAPGAPSAPSAPGAPSAPKAPGAPKPPTA